MADDKVKASELPAKSVGTSTTLVGLDTGDNTCSRYDITNIPVAQTVATQTITGDQTVEGTSYVNVVNIDSGNAQITTLNNNLEINNTYAASIKGVINGQTNFDANYDGTDNTFTVNGKVETDLLKVTTGAAVGKVLKSDADGNATWQTDNTGSGDVVGPSSPVVDSNLAAFDSATGKRIKDAGVPASQVTTNMGNISANTINIATNVTAIATKLDEANSIFRAGYSKYCADGRDDLATVINSITNEGTIVNLSSGSFGGTTPVTINKNNIAIFGPPSTPGLVEFLYEITTASTADRIRMRYMMFDADFTAAAKRSTYNHCSFTENLSIETSATPGYMTFANCGFAAEKIISVQNTFASVIYFINCNFSGCSFSLNQATSQQVIFSNCGGFTSFPANATYAGINTLTSGYIQNTVTKTELASGSGTAGQVLTSGGANTPDTWTTISPGGSGDVVGPNSATSGNLTSFNTATGKLVQDSGISSSSVLTTASNINSLNNVSTTAPTNGQILVYNSTSSEWEPGEDSGNNTVIVNTAGTGTVTAPQNTKSVRITLGGAGSGGSGAGQSQASGQTSAYHGAGGSGGSQGDVKKFEIPSNAGSVYFYDLKAGGAGGTGQGLSGSATAGLESFGFSKVYVGSSAGGHELVSCSGGLGGYAPQTTPGGSANTQSSSAQGANGYLSGGGAGAPGYYQDNSGNRNNGITAMGGSAGGNSGPGPFIGTDNFSGQASTITGIGNSAVIQAGAGGLSTAPLAGYGVGGSGGGAFGGVVTSVSANGVNGTMGCGGSGGSARQNGSAYTPGTDGGNGGDGYVIFEFIR